VPNFVLVYEAVLADNGRLKYIERIAERFVDLTMEHKGEMKVVVRTVIVSRFSISFRKQYLFEHLSIFKCYLPYR
jgi:hypothetical protein